MKTFQVKKEDNLIIITISPTLDQEDYIELRRYIKESFLDKGERTIVLDCDAVVNFPSIAFGTFCSIARDAKRVRGRFVLVHVSAEIRDVLETTHANKIVDVMQSLAEIRKAASLV